MRERKTPSKILAILLTLCLLLSLFPLSAAAVETDGSTVRYTVLVLDTSGSMGGTPAQEQKEAAKKFVSSLSSANGTNYVALISFSSNASVQCEFTTDLSALQTSIDELRTVVGLLTPTKLYRKLENCLMRSRRKAQSKTLYCAPMDCPKLD